VGKKKKIIAFEGVPHEGHIYVLKAAAERKKKRGTVERRGNRKSRRGGKKTTGRTPRKKGCSSVEHRKDFETVSGKSETKKVRHKKKERKDRIAKGEGTKKESAITSLFLSDWGRQA